MVTAIVLINCKRDQINHVAEKLAETKDITEVYSVAGRYDLVAIIRAHSNDELAEVVTRHMLELPGIDHTETLIAFRALSQHDLEQMFSIGLDP